jgi:outer membrane protein TolC
MMSRIATLLALSLPLAALAQEPQAPAPTAPPPATPPPGEELRLSLAEAERLALEHNLDLQVARTSPEIAREVVDQALGAYDPLGFAEYKFDHREQPVASTVLQAFGTGAAIEEDQWDYVGGFRGVVPWGIQYSSTYDMRRLDSTSGFQALDREYRPAWISQLTVPLLKDFRWNAVDVAVKRSKIGQDVSDEDFRRFVTDLIVAVEDSYWSLVALRENERVARKSQQVASDLLDQTRVQYEVGVVSKVLVKQAEAGLAQREVATIVAQNLAKTGQDNLLNTILAPTADRLRDTRLVIDDPTYVEYPVDEQGALRRAMERRPELLAARKRVEDAEVELAYRMNQRLPRLDLTGGYTFSGISGPQKISPGYAIGQQFYDSDFDNVPDTPLTAGGGEPLCTGRAAQPLQAGNAFLCGTVQPDQVDNEASDSHDDFFDASGAHGWAAGVRMEIPIGNQTARSRAAQAEIELRRANTQLRQTEQVVILDVRKAARDVVDAIAALEAAERRREAQEETLRAEQEKLRLGDSTPREVLEFEEDLAEAEREGIVAGQRYRTAITRFEKAQASLLEARGIQLESVVR